MTPPARTLTADCDRCAALCCVAPPFRQGADFAVHKPEGVRCPRLGGDDRCTVHAGLRAHGFPACAAFDCLGAGQRVVQETFAGVAWRHDPVLRAGVHDTFFVMWSLHALLWALDHAAGWAPGLRPELHAAATHLDRMAQETPPAALSGALSAEWGPTCHLLRRCSAALRPARIDLCDADLEGADLRGRDLRDADLRDARLVGADLRGLDLGRADLFGVDLRRARLGGADLSRALFLTPMQLRSAWGDAETRLPPHLPAVSGIMRP